MLAGGALCSGHWNVPKIRAAVAVSDKKKGPAMNPNPWIGWRAADDDARKPAPRP